MMLFPILCDVSFQQMLDVARLMLALAVPLLIVATRYVNEHTLQYKTPAYLRLIPVFLVRVELTPQWSDNIIRYYYIK